MHELVRESGSESWRRDEAGAEIDSQPRTPAGVSPGW